jgi:DNA-binding PadR family transcriptional regulator
MEGLTEALNGASVRSSVLDLFILSLFDRGHETAYDLQCHAGVSLGSSTPVLKRLKASGFVKQAAQAGSSKRLRHKFELTAAGRKLAHSGWVLLLKDRPPSDLDSILRLVDVARHYQAKAGGIATFLEAAASDRRLAGTSGRAGPGKTRDAVGIMATREGWSASRLDAEAKFLASLAKSLRRKVPNQQRRADSDCDGWCAG